MPLRRRPPSRIVRPLMVVGAVAALLALAAPALAGWSAPAALPLPSGAGGWYEDDVTVAPLPDGTVVAAVNANAGGFRAAVSVLSGGAWATQYLDALGSDDPMVSWDGAGQAVAVWRQLVGGRVEVLAARRAADGTWVSEGTVSGSLDVRYKFHGISRGPNGDIALGICPGRAPYVVRRVGGVWGAPVQVPASGVLAGLDCDDGRQLFATAQDGSGGTWVRAEVSGTMRVAYLNAAGTWQYQENLTSGGSNSYYQRLVVTGDGTPIAMWSTTTGDVTARVRTGGAWGTPQIVDDSGSATQTGVRLVASSYAAGAVGSWVDSVSCGMSCSENAAKGASRTGGAWGATRIFTPDPQPSVGEPYPALDAMGGAHYLLRDGNSLSAADPTGATAAVAASGVTRVRGMAGDSRGRLVAVWATTANTYAASILTQPPGVPVDAIASATGERTIEVTWSAPLVDGGEAVTGYAVTTVPATTGCPSVTATTCTLTGLDPNTTYAISISAVNAVGTGAANTWASATTPAAAGVVTAATGQQAPAAAGGPAVRIAGATARPGGRIATRVTVAGPGRITVTGTRAGGRARPATVCATAKRVRKAGTYALVCVADKATRAALRGRAVKVVLDVVFAPTGGTPTATTQTVTLPRAARG
jgi:hypothetical protein